MNKGILRKFKNTINQNIVILIWVMVAGCLALLIVSYLFPKESFITSAYNVLLGEEDKRFDLSMDPGKVITYEMTTAGKPLFGFQPFITKHDATIEKGDIVFQIYNKDSYYHKGKYFSKIYYPLADISNEQYIYVSIPEYELCDGNIIIEIFYEEDGAKGQDYPCLVANDNHIVKAITYENGMKIDGSLVCYHVYLKKDYPLVYDMQILFVFFLAIAMTITGCKKHGKETQVME